MNKEIRNHKNDQEKLKDRIYSDVHLHIPIEIHLKHVIYFFWLQFACFASQAEVMVYNVF